MSEEYNAPEIPEKPKRGSDRNGNNPSFSENPPARMIAALSLIGLGVIFLLQQFGLFSLTGNWWAIFILIPALGLLYNGYTTYRNGGGWSMEAQGQLTGGAAMLLVAGIFIFGLDWGKVWPLFLILGGIFALFNYRR
ncbi:MAG: hypothetical protein ABI947_15950 [Chloroflexota bacterium]